MNKTQDEDFGFWITPLNPDLTGLQVDVYPCIEIQKQPVLYVPTHYKRNEFCLSPFSITLEDKIPIVIGSTGDISKDDIEAIKSFIIINRRILLDHWNNNGDSLHLIRSIRKYEKDVNIKLIAYYSKYQPAHFPYQLNENYLGSFNNLVNIEKVLNEKLNHESLSQNEVLYFLAQEMDGAFTKQVSIYKRNGEYYGFHQMHKKYFFGRTEDECPLKLGEIVFFLEGNNLNIGIIIAYPPSPSKAKRIIEAARSKGMPPFMDFSDDSFEVLGLDGQIKHIPVFFAFNANIKGSLAKRLKVLFITCTTTDG